MKTTGKTQEGDIWYDPTDEMNDKIDMELFLKILPKREADVLAMKMDGFGNKEIADSLGISLSTVEKLNKWLKVKFEKY